jgi:hypothetical protein
LGWWACSGALRYARSIAARHEAHGMKTTATTSRRWLLPLVLGALMSVLLLTACSPATKTDPISAASVDNRPITLASYTQVVNVYRILSARQQTASDWQTVSGRKGLADVQTQALNFLINLEIYRMQMDKLGLHASSAVITSDKNQLLKSIDDQIKATPDDTSLVALKNALAGDVIGLFAEQDADQKALMASPKLQVPVVHARVLLAKKQADAQAMLTQLQGGAKFATLAATHDDQSVPAGGDFGTVYLGELSGLPSFDQKAFLDQPNNAPAMRYVILNDAGQWELFELTQPGMKSIASITDPQTQQAVFAAWLKEVATPHVNIHTYVGV